MKQLDINYEYFKKNMKDLIKKYCDEYIVIANEAVVFHDKSRENAINFVKTLKAGTYILQKCEKEQANSIQMFHTRVSF